MTADNPGKAQARPDNPAATDIAPRRSTSTPSKALYTRRFFRYDDQFVGGDPLSRRIEQDAASLLVSPLRSVGRSVERSTHKAWMDE
jgi:hypothetical protein